MFTLTPKEQEVALLMARGVKPGEIAKSLGKSIKTVDVQMRGVYKKLNITTGDKQMMLIRMAIRRGWEGACSAKR